MMGSVLLLFLFFCVVSLRSEFHVYCNCRKKNDVRVVISSICLWESSCFIGVICVDLCSWWCPGHFVLWFCLFFFVLCTLCCQFLCVVFCLSSSCVPYVASFSVLWFCLFVFVLCTLCCQFLCVVFCLSSSCVPYVASFSGLSNCDCSFGIL
jgi:hypothetical protein